MEKLKNFLWEDFVWCLGARKLWYLDYPSWVMNRCGRSKDWLTTIFTDEPKDEELEVEEIK